MQSDYVSRNSILMAAQWTQNLLLGSIATVIAIVAVAILGFMMLSGRIDWRRGLSVVFGCFVLFVAPRIAAALISLGDVGTLGTATRPLIAAAVPPPVVARQPDANYDPYAGASIIRQAPPPIAAQAPR